MNLKLLNPNFVVNETDNIFNLRQREFDNIIDKVKLIVKPVEEIGFEILEVSLKDSRFSSGELNKTLKKNLVIRIQKGQNIIDISMFIPSLIDGNYIQINGRRKIPLFQLFDVPVVTRGSSIKLRTNVATLMIFKDKQPPYVKISFLGKKVPLSTLMFAYYGFQELNNKFNFSSIEADYDSKDLYEILLYELKDYYEDAIGSNQDDSILELGRNYGKYDARTKGENVVYAIDLIPKVDIMTAEFLQTDSILEEILEIIKTGGFIDDTLLTNKRIRCFEYMILSRVSKAIFDLCIANRTARQPKFNINSTIILSECNVSDIVQFDFSINPIEELTKLSRISLLGPGGFSRENVPNHLRDIFPTMFGRLCPVDTPDRDNCGVLQNLLPNVILTENMRFSNEKLENPISIPVSMTPFLEHDDQTRLQMAASQMRQSILLRKFDKPMIQSGCEGLYTNYTQFVKKAKKDGEVLFIDDKYLIVAYDDTDIDIFDIRYRKIYVENMDIMDIYVKIGDKFKAGDILAESNFCKNGEINFGKNLLTAIIPHYGNNYEDGIILSQRLVDEDCFTSIHYKDLSFRLPENKVLKSLIEGEYKPLPDSPKPATSKSPKKVDILEIGQPYAKIKEVISFDPYSVFREEVILEAKKRLIISEVNIYANSWNQEIPEFAEWVEKKVEEQKSKDDAFKEILKNFIGREEATNFIKDNGRDRFSFSGKYKNKKKKIEGIYVEMFGIYFRKIKVGDKIANRHGNKGVISNIIPHEKMPKLDDGRHVDICINPLGIISRMNVGQLYEIQLTSSLEDLKKEMNEMLKDSKSNEEIKKYLLDYIKIVDNTKTGWYFNQFEEQLPKIIDIKFIDELNLIQPPFESVSPSKIIEASDYTNTDFEHNIYDPLTETMIENKVAVGNIYFFRMVHIAENRLAARGIGAYTKRTLQPLGGRKLKGGQRCGEMETGCLAAHDATENLFEFLTVKSDCIDLKRKYIEGIVNFDMISDSKEDNIVPESVKLLNAYLTVCGLNHQR